MTFPYPFVGPRRSVSATYIGMVSESGDFTNYTFTAVNIGSPGLVAIVISGSSAGNTINSVTIGGVSANILTATNQSTGSSISVMAWLRVASGTTADIVVNWSGQMKRCSVAVYRITGNSKDAPYNVVVATPAAVTTLSIASGIPNGAAGIFASVADTGTSYTWTGIAEDYDTQIDTTGTMTVSGGHISKYNRFPPYTVTATVGASGNVMTLVSAAWI